MLMTAVLAGAPLLALAGPVGSSGAFDTSVPIPEPATLALLGAGVVGMIIAGRNRNKRK
ncbi:MAG: PEP-CTERM sorting domain-containing protein [Candidatus Levyibacteriota bacterium]